MGIWSISVGGDLWSIGEGGQSAMGICAFCYI